MPYAQLATHVTAMIAQYRRQLLLVAHQDQFEPLVFANGMQSGRHHHVGSEIAPHGIQRYNNVLRHAVKLTRAARGPPATRALHIKLE